ncbi:MAG TPA: asparaginase, partial [Thermoproteales archaeon]|nr:asparaginase [Thermoproteales archaeon]
MLVASYHPFGLEAVKRAREILLKGGSALDAVEEGIKVVEENPHIRSVGIGGIPNFDGEVELDAAIMDGKTLKCGAVAAVKKVKHPISLARKVMEKTPHVLIVGEGALRLARVLGLDEVDLPLPEALKAYKEIKQKTIKGREKNEYIRIINELLKNQGITDTIGVIAIDKDGNIAAGTSSSGAPLKFPGRVGDSPIIGAGLYADNSAGAAICTGWGEIAVRTAAAKTAIDLLEEGYSPQKVAHRVIEKVNRICDRENLEYALGIVVVDRAGNVGAAANFKNFTYVYWSDDVNE